MHIYINFLLGFFLYFFILYISTAHYSFSALNSLSVLLLFSVSSSNIESKFIGFIVHFYDAADLGSEQKRCVFMSSNFPNLYDMAYFGKYLNKISGFAVRRKQVYFAAVFFKQWLNCKDKQLFTLF